VTTVPALALAVLALVVVGGVATPLSSTVRDGVVSVVGMPLAGDGATSPVTIGSSRAPIRTAGIGGRLLTAVARLIWRGLTAPWRAWRRWRTERARRRFERRFRQEERRTGAAGEVAEEQAMEDLWEQFERDARARELRAERRRAAMWRRLMRDLNRRRGED
jgi:hypothetical protein